MTASMTDIQIFSNPQFGEIRTAIGENGEPMFCLTDVAKALGYSRPADAVSTHCKGVSILPTPTNGGVQQVKFGKEGDVYRLVMKSKLPEVGMFQDWVCDEVLPAIRKHGVYATPQTIDNLLADPDNAIKVFQTLKEERQLRQIAEANRLKVQAGLTPQEKAEWDYKTAVGVAEALANSKVQWVPQVMMGGQQGGSTAMDAVGLKMLLDVSNSIKK